MRAWILDSQTLLRSGVIERLIRRHQRDRREARLAMVTLDIEGR
jgi:hypothetical protein